jgi:hypothetical protein
MKRVLLCLIGFLCSPASLAFTSDASDTCISLYAKAEHYLARANGELWSLHRSGILTYHQLTAAQNKNTEHTFDYFWRINRNSRIGSVADCRRDAADIKWLIDSNLEQIRNDVTPRRAPRTQGTM